MPVSSPVNSVVVDDDDVVVGGEVDIKLDMVDTHRERLVVGGEGVLRRV